MNKIIYLFLLSGFLCLTTEVAKAGNPDRQGEAGAYELLMNPWARSAGLHTMTTANVTGVNALRLNVAGLARVNKTQIVGSHAQYLQGSGITMNAVGLSQRVGENGAFGFSLMSLDFGDIPITTTNQPEGTGATFSPSFINIGLGYSHIFENKVSVGVVLRAVSERIADLQGNAFAIDAGVQYVTGEQDNFKIGISLRNVGGRMRFNGEGISFPSTFTSEGNNYNLAINQRAADFELQSVLNIGLSYDVLFGAKNRLTFVGNFTSNAFSRDQIGGGVEYSFNKMFALRGGYKYELGSTGVDAVDAPLYTGPSAGFSVDIPLGKDTDEKMANRVGIDYAYRMTKILGGTHNISVRLDL